MSETPNYLSNVEERLMKMGWVSKSGSRDLASGNALHGIAFTPTGSAKLKGTPFNDLIAQVEMETGPLSKHEKSVFSGFPMLARRAQPQGPSSRVCLQTCRGTLQRGANQSRAMMFTDRLELPEPLWKRLKKLS